MPTPAWVMTSSYSPSSHLRCRPTRLWDLFRRLTEPILETRLAELRVIAGNQHPLAHLDTVVARVRVRNYLAGVPTRRQVQPDKFIQTKLFWSPDFDGAVHRWAHCDSDQCTGYIVGCHRLNEYRRQAYLVALRRQIGEALYEFKELRRTDD